MKLSWAEYDDDENCFSCELKLSITYHDNLRPKLSENKTKHSKKKKP